MGNKAKERISKKGVCLSGGKKCSFFEKLGLLCFLATAVLRFVFEMHHYQRYQQISNVQIFVALSRALNFDIRTKSINRRVATGNLNAEL